MNKFKVEVGFFFFLKERRAMKPERQERRMDIVPDIRRSSLKVSRYDYYFPKVYLQDLTNSWGGELRQGPGFVCGQVTSEQPRRW